MPPSHRQFRTRLTFSNVVSLIALFVALGGSAYAVGVLPANSVGRQQLQANAVTANKLAPNSVGSSELKLGSVTGGSLALGSVGFRALDPAVRARLAKRTNSGKRGSSGTQGPVGPEGPTGPQGPSGPGAARVVYSAKALASPTPQTVLDIGGLRMDAECEATDQGTQLNLSISSAEAGTGVENINVDNGTGIPGFAESKSANLQIELPAGTTNLGGPSAATGEYSRILAHLVYVTQKSTVDLSVALVLDGTAQTCRIDGVGVPATS